MGASREGVAQEGPCVRKGDIGSSASALGAELVAGFELKPIELSALNEIMNEMPSISYEEMREFLEKGQKEGDKALADLISAQCGDRGEPRKNDTNAAPEDG